MFDKFEEIREFSCHFGLAFLTFTAHVKPLILYSWEVGIAMAPSLSECFSGNCGCVGGVVVVKRPISLRWPPASSLTTIEIEFDQPKK